MLLLQKCILLKLLFHNVQNSFCHIYFFIAMDSIELVNIKN